MKFGVREICDVVLKAKAPQKVGNKIFYTNEPVLYFDTLKTSSMEGAANTVYAQGGAGNSRLVAWEGERTVTFTMEDALISPEGFMILSGAGLVEASESKPVIQHLTERVADVTVDAAKGELTIPVSKRPYFPVDKDDKLIESEGNFAYVMLVKDDEIVSEPYIPVAQKYDEEAKEFTLTIAPHNIYDTAEVETGEDQYDVNPKGEFPAFDSVIVDYYTAHKADAMQIEITPDKFGGNYYLEASTLFRDTRGVDMPAEFIIPNCKIQSSFNFTMASSGDPSTFTFTMDAFPDYTRFDRSKKVLAAIQIIKEAGSQSLYRKSTVHSDDHDVIFG
jgi:hypothetical protein